MFTALVVLCALGTSGAKPTKRAATSPIMGGKNFPDPAIIRVHNDGWHLFSTNAKVDGKQIHIQRAFTKDFKTFQLRNSVDALPRLPAWVDGNPRVWAPDVVQRADGSFVMYYTAALKSNPRLHCLSYATAKKITGPFVDNSKQPWICPLKQGGAIDIAGFTDERNGGKRYVVYKIDGNAIGHGGSCGNTVKPIVRTPILLQEVGKDGVTLIGSPKQILTNIASDGPYVEAPALTFMNGRYVLFFSSQCYTTDGYDVQYAVSDKIAGPYKRMGRVLGTGDFGMKGPGGLDVAINGEKAVWHGWVPKIPLTLPQEFDEKKHCKNFEKRTDCHARHYETVRPTYVGTVKMDGNGRVSISPN